MNGFYITVSNGLLQGNHFKRMGEAVWVFMWLLDKMTSISEEGVGLVLGGKPVKFEDIARNLNGLSERSYRRHIDILKKQEYINTKRTPYGLAISVNKAKKMFGQQKEKIDKNKRYAKNGTSENKEKRDMPKTAHLITKNGTSNRPKMAHLIKTIQYDNTVDKDINNNTNVLAAEAAEKKDDNLNHLIGLFQGINPFYKKIFPNKTERSCLNDFIQVVGGYQKAEEVILKLPAIVILPYAPRISKPSELVNNWSKLLMFMQQEKKKKGGIVDARGII